MTVFEDRQEAHRRRVLEFQEAEAKRLEKGTTDPLLSIAISLKRIADAMRDEPNRG